jgi:DNA-binding HxlR family transcriptional regulator
MNQTPSKLFNPYRVWILIDLKFSGKLRFNKLRDDIGLSNGNLSTHLRALEKEGFIKSNTFLDKKKLVSYIIITFEGMKALDEFREQLKNMEKVLSKN